MLNPRMVNSVSHFRLRSGQRILSSVMSISVPIGMTEVFSRLHCRPLIEANSLRYLTAFLRLVGVLSIYMVVSVIIILLSFLTEHYCEL